MSRPVHLRQPLALAAALVVTSWGVAALPAAAEGGAPTPSATPSAKGEPRGHAQAPGQHKEGAKDGAKGGAKGHGDPAGNNGTVKVAELGDLDRIPNNSPHPGCTFQIEWYGYDQGADIVSQVSFAMQAPTSDVALSVDGPSSVFVGGDPASGAGTDSGLDGREAYALSFTGEPHPQQGYHVRLTVATPRSHGNDTKSKMFWVEPCDTTTGMDTASASAAPTPEAGGVGGAGASGSHHESAPDTEVLGIQATAAPQPHEAGSAQVAPTQAEAPSRGVPTAVDAGENRHTVLASMAGSPWPLALVGAGAALTVGALVARRRRTGDVQG